MKETSVGIKHFMAAFRYSMSGFRFAVRESAVRQELLLGAASAIMLVFFNFELMLKLLLATLWVFVLVTELLNTAIEAVVDLVSPNYHDLAKKAKDLGSAAVFCSLSLYLIVWGVVLFAQV